MPAPLNPNLWPAVLHDEDGVPISATNPLPVTGSGGGSSPNQPTFAQNQKRPAAAGTGEQLQSQAVPDGFTVFVRAFPGNTDTVYIGKSKANSENTSVGSPLEPGAFATLALTNVDEIWVNTLTTGDGVFWYVEAAS
jgi:hypothetical protein